MPQEPMDLSAARVTEWHVFEDKGWFGADVAMEGRHVARLGLFSTKALASEMAALFRECWSPHVRTTALPEPSSGAISAATRGD